MDFKPNEIVTITLERYHNLLNHEEGNKNRMSAEQDLFIFINDWTAVIKDLQSMRGYVIEQKDVLDLVSSHPMSKHDYRLINNKLQIKKK